MHSALLIFEFLGTSEMMVIALVALIIFGPRKLPEIGRTIGKSLAEFKRASDDFKRTWEYEVELEGRKHTLDAGQTTSDQQANQGAVANGFAAEGFVGRAAQINSGEQTFARDSTAHTVTHDPWAAAAVPGAEASTQQDEEDEGGLNAS